MHTNSQRCLKGQKTIYICSTCTLVYTNNTKIIAAITNATELSTPEAIEKIINLNRHLCLITSSWNTSSSISNSSIQRECVVII